MVSPSSCSRSTVRALKAEFELTRSVQTTGPTEASRAIRKKLKYGSVPQQLRALTVRRNPVLSTFSLCVPAVR